MKLVKSTILALSVFTAVTTFPIKAQEYRFTYSKLFAQLKNNVKPGHDEVKVALFFIDTTTHRPCVIQKAWMEKEQHYERLSTGYANELLVPIDNNLRQANPLIFVHTPETKQCDFSMVVMSKTPLSGEVTYTQIEHLLPQMEALLADLGGMFSSWFTPNVSGLTLEFEHDQQGHIFVSDGNHIAIENGKAVVLLDRIGVGNSVTLPAKTLRVLPYISKR